MNFADRIQEQAREKVCPGAIGLTKERYDKAVEQALSEMMDTIGSKGPVDMIMPIIGITFASRVRTLIFKEEDE